MSLVLEAKWKGNHGHLRKFKLLVADLHVFCGNDSIGRVSLHRAVLASCSNFLSDILSERDETFLLLPDVDKNDFMALVHLVYNENFGCDGVEMPSFGLLKVDQPGANAINIFKP